MAKENDNFALHATGDEEAAMSSSAWQNIVGFDTTIVPTSHKKLLRSMAHTKGNQIAVFPEDIRILPGFNPRLGHGSLKPFEDGKLFRITRDESAREKWKYRNAPVKLTQDMHPCVGAFRPPYWRDKDYVWTPTA